MLHRQPTVSVIVPTKDVSRTIERCLSSIRGQSWQALELIVIDNFSKDRTWEIAEGIADVALQAGPERSSQRNLGISLAKGQYILWIDADMVLTPRVVEDAVLAAEREEATAVFIPEVTVGTGFLTACRALERRCYVGVELIEAPRLIRRSFFDDHVGFVEELSGQEDAELRMRLLEDRARMVHIDTYILHDEGHLTLGQVLRKRYYYGQFLPTYNRQQPGAIGAQGSATLKAMAKGLPILAEQPVHAVALIALRGAEAAAYSFGAARALWSQRTGELGRTG